jgi:hypothetical protein
VTDLACAKASGVIPEHWPRRASTPGDLSAMSAAASAVTAASVTTGTVATVATVATVSTCVSEVEAPGAGTGAVVRWHIVGT